MRLLLKLHFLLLLCFITFCDNLQAYNLRHVTHKDGLSNSAILSIMQDQDGFVWFGTVDGLNKFDGTRVDIYKMNDTEDQLSGNLIENIKETDRGIFWVHTNYGLDLINKNGKRYNYFRQFQGQYFMVKNKDGNILIIKEDGIIHYYNTLEKKFDSVKVGNIEYSNILNLILTDTGLLYIFTKEGHNLQYKIDVHTTGVIEINEQESIKENSELLYSFSSEDNSNILYIIDKAGLFYEYNLENDKKYFKYDLSATINKLGDISSIIKHHNDYFIGFKTNGLLKLTYSPSIDSAFSIEDIGIRSGIFCLHKDKYQDLVWIGTDGEGVYMYSNDMYSFKNAEYTSFAEKIVKPARALLLDSNNSLWIGTKGDGIIRIKNFDNKLSPALYNTEYLNISNRKIIDNSIYAFAESSSHIIWLGGENGLYYYSYANDKVDQIALKANGEAIKYVHSICELNDSTLWLATVGAGIVRAKIKKDGKDIGLEDIRQIKVHNGKEYSNYFYTIYKEDENTLWFGNRGYGAYRVDNRSMAISNVTLDDKDGHSRSINDVYAITKDADGSFWFGTSYGLVKKEPSGVQTLFNKQNGFLNNIVHGILPGSGNDIWLSTNKGIVKFNTKDEIAQTYSSNNGLTIVEYSDGASYIDEKTSTLFFGGIDGFISFTKSGLSGRNYLPQIYLDNLSILGKKMNLANFLFTDENNNQVLELEHDQNFFSISFAAPDYVDGNNYVYYYRIENTNDKWIDNGLSTEINFTNLGYGDYNLELKYLNKLTGKESPVRLLIIDIIPPWYLSRWVKAIYLVAITFFFFSLLYLQHQRDIKKKKKVLFNLSLKHKEESYESKLQFFTNIAHEFSTPLTLIDGPCKRILSHQGTDNFVRKHAQTIERNTERLNNLIQDLIEFRSIESGDRVPVIEAVPINEVVTIVIDSFSEIINSKNISFEQKTENQILWNTDESFIYTIITSLLSNACINTPSEGEIELTVGIEKNQLVLHFTYTGKGIEEKHLKRIFDRYSVLDDLELHRGKGIAYRNGLGLVISNNMVYALGGHIEVDSVMYDKTSFVVYIPNNETSKESVSVSESIRQQPNLRIDDRFESELPTYKNDPTKKTILIIDNDLETLIFLSEVFITDYNVIAQNDTDKMNEILLSNHPDIILCDFAPTESNIKLIKSIKENKSTAHISMILMSTEYSVEEQMKGMDAGAEMFISKPFNIDYIRKSVLHLISRKNVLKDYFNSPLSAFNLSNNKLIHNENSKFTQEVLDIIEKNITDKDLSAKFIADKLNMSTRHLYRKLKESESENLTDIIRETRLYIARNLLINTQMTVEEIIFKSGFTNKSTFFRVFANKYDMTPQRYREQELLEIENMKMGKKKNEHSS